MSLVTLQHSFINWFEKELTTLENKAPAIERIVDAGVTYGGQALQIGLTLVGDPAAAALVTPIVVQAQSDLKVASALVTDFGPTPTAASVFTSVQTNLNSLLAAGHITNAKSVAAVNKAVTEVGALASAVSTAATQVTAAATA